MIKSFPLGTLLLLLVLTSAAQNPTPGFEKLKLNSSPAFVLLGVEPENLQRPSSPNQFIGGLQNAIVNDKLKPNVAFEVTPYFWKNPNADNKRFNFEQYLTHEKSIWKNIVQTFSMSLGTSESDTVIFGKMRPGTGLGLGVRFTLLDGRAPTPNVDRLRRWYIYQIRRSIIEDIINEVEDGSDKSKQTIINEAIKKAEGMIGKPGLYNVATRDDFNAMASALRFDFTDKLSLADAAFVKQADALLMADKKDESAVLAQINSEKVPFAKNGFMLEAAYGSAVVFQNNKWDSAQHARAAVWLTPSYRWQVNKDPKNISLFDLIGVVRLSFNNKQDSVDVSNYLDLGLKTQYTHNKWSFSAEYVYRKASEKVKDVKRDYTYRLVSSLDYKLTEEITFKFSFGTNFDGNTATYTKPKELFAVGGLNLGIFNPKSN